MKMPSLRNSLFSGILLLLPLGVTIMVVNFLLEKIGGPSSRLFFGFLDPHLRDPFWIKLCLNVLSTFIVLMLITLFGFLSNYFLGRFLVRSTERIIQRLPLVNTIYKTVKQLVDTFSEQSMSSFQQTVLVHFPLKNTYSIGFITNEAKGEVQEKTAEQVVNVFVPTTPNPTSGFLLLVPKVDIIYLNMPVGDAIKLVISGGCITPDYPYIKKGV